MPSSSPRDGTPSGPNDSGGTMSYDEQHSDPDLPRQRVTSLLVFDPRSYRRHRGYFLYADRIFLGRVWTPVVRVRPRLPRASDGGTEI